MARARRCWLQRAWGRPSWRAQWLPREFEAASQRAGGLLRQPPAGDVVFHPPCTLQHGQQLRGGVEQHLGALGFNVKTASCEAHLCCGSAGTYSVLQPKIANELRDRKLGNLSQMKPDVIVSANIGCITHLQSGTATPVRHWVEVLDEALSQAG
jgi:glycolate oxidase iron-sulfur subunit